MIPSEFARDLAEGTDDVSAEDAQVFLDALPPWISEERARKLFGLALDMAAHYGITPLGPASRALAVALSQWRKPDPAKFRLDG